MKKKQLLKDLLIGQLMMIRMRLVQDIAEIDEYVEQIKRRFERGSKKP